VSQVCIISFALFRFDEISKGVKQLGSGFIMQKKIQKKLHTNIFGFKLQMVKNSSSKNRSRIKKVFFQKKRVLKKYAGMKIKLEIKSLSLILSFFSSYH